MHIREWFKDVFVLFVYFNLERFVMIKIVLSEHKKLMYKVMQLLFISVEYRFHCKCWMGL